MDYEFSDGQVSGGENKGSVGWQRDECAHTQYVAKIHLPHSPLLTWFRALNEDFLDPEFLLEAYRLVPKVTDTRQAATIRAVLDHAKLAARIACELAWEHDPAYVDYARVCKDLAVSLRDAQVNMGLMHGDLGNTHRPSTNNITLSLPRASLVMTLTPPLVEALLEPMVNALTQPIALEALASPLRDAVFKPLSMRLQDALHAPLRTDLHDDLFAKLLPQLRSALVDELVEPLASRLRAGSSLSDTTSTASAPAPQDPLSIPSGFKVAKTSAVRSRYSCHPCESLDNTRVQFDCIDEAGNYVGMHVC